MPKILKAILILSFLSFYFFYSILPVSAEGSLLLFDDFNDGNLNGWVVENGNWSVNNGTLLTTETGVIAFRGAIHSGDPAWDNYIIEADINNESGVDEGIDFRRSDDGNYYSFNLRHGPLGLDAPLKLFKTENNNPVMLQAKTNIELLNNTWYHVRIEVLNENIKFYLNGSLIFEYSDPGTNLKKGAIGFYSWTGAPGFLTARFDNVKVTSFVPVPTKTPLILIPGIGGSELKVNEETIWSKPDGHGGTFSKTYSANEKVWVNELQAIIPGNDDYFDVLRMKPDGITSEASISLTGNLFSGAYQDAINFFTANGYILNQDFFVFPYDWREDNTQNTNLLDEKIEAIKTQTGSSKVDIIAHSMGGLIARKYISDTQKAQNVRKLFALGTPHLGSTDFLKNLRFGGCLRFQVGPFCLLLAPSEVKDVIQNTISGFQLSPSQSYFTFYTGDDTEHPYPYLTDLGQLDYGQIKTLLTVYGHNTSLFNPSETFHSMDTNLENTNGVDTVLIAGSGQSTLGQIKEIKTTNLFGAQITHKDMLNINGDDTVPLFSASLDDPDRNKSLLGSAKVYYTNQTHGNLVSSGPALNLVKNILSDNTTIPDGVSTTPFKFSGHKVSVHSPVNIHAYDSSGNHTGPTSDGFEENIPGSSYETLDDAKFIWLPENGQYTLKFEATDQGSFDFKIREFEDNVNIKSVLYQDISLTTTTKAQTTFDTNSSQSPILQIDQDGNGTTDKQVSATSTLTGDQNYDQTTPLTNTKLTGTKGQNNWFTTDVKVDLEVENETNGSGILKTEYTLNNSQTVQTYTGPFTISTDGVTKIKFRSIDKAGNEESSQEIEVKIDTTSPEAKIFVDQGTQNLVVRGLDQNSITVEKTSNLATKKKDDAVYKLTDSAGNILKLDVREVDKEKQDKFRIYSIQYNNNQVQILEKNHFNVSYQGKKAKKNVKEQNFELKGEIKIKIQYDQKKDKSTIIVKEPKQEKVKEVRAGLTILQLTTNKGKLEASY